jgi:hypothetical protein
MFAIVAIVIVVIPVAVRAPTVAVLIPPTAIAVVAILARFAQLVPRFFCLPAVTAMVFYRFMKTMIRFRDTPLAIVVIGAQSRCAGEEQKSRQRRTRQR